MHGSITNNTFDIHKSSLWKIILKNQKLKKVKKSMPFINIRWRQEVIEDVRICKGHCGWRLSSTITENLKVLSFILFKKSFEQAKT